jgi:hypothetical protein
MKKKYKWAGVKNQDGRTIINFSNNLDFISWYCSYDLYDDYSYEIEDGILYFKGNKRKYLDVVWLDNKYQPSILSDLEPLKSDQFKIKNYFLSKEKYVLFKCGIYLYRKDLMDTKERGIRRIITSNFYIVQKD